MKKLFYLLCIMLPVHTMQQLGTKTVLLSKYPKINTSASFTHKFCSKKEIPWPLSLDSFSKSKNYNELRTQIPLLDKQTKLFLVKQMQNHKKVIEKNLISNEKIRSDKYYAFGASAGGFVLAGFNLFMVKLSGGHLLQDLVNESLLGTMISAPFFCIFCITSYDAVKMGAKDWYEFDRLKKVEKSNFSTFQLKNEITEIEKTEQELKK